MNDPRFLECPPRKDTGCLKWDTSKAGVLPFWVADMDFAVPECVTEALADRISHPVFGYGLVDREYLDALANWYRTGLGTEILPREILLAPGVMPSMAMALRTLTAPGDRVMAFTPVYRPFLDMVRLSGRTLVESPLVTEGRRWTMDFERTEEILKASREDGRPVKVLLFCSPHNPVGRVWTLPELLELSRLAEEYSLTVFSDEIHQDLVFAPHRHRVLCTVSPELSLRTVVFSGMGKTFNLAGLPLAHIITFSPGLRAALKEALDGEFFHHPNILSQTAAKAALLGGSSWLNALLRQVEENYQTLCRHLPVGMVEGLPAPLEGTYLAWVDFSPLIRKKGLPGDTELAAALEARAGLRFSPGSWFGGPPGYLRINLACPPSQLLQGLERLVSFR